MADGRVAAMLVSDRGTGLVLQACVRVGGDVGSYARRGAVSRLMFSPNGAWLAAAVGRKSFVLESGTWRPLATLRDHGSRVTAVDWSVDGVHLRTEALGSTGLGSTGKTRANAASGSAKPRQDDGGERQDADEAGAGRANRSEAHVYECFRAQDPDGDEPWLSVRVAGGEEASSGGGALAPGPPAGGDLGRAPPGTVWTGACLLDEAVRGVLESADADHEALALPRRGGISTVAASSDLGLMVCGDGRGLLRLYRYPALPAAKCRAYAGHSGRVASLALTSDGGLVSVGEQDGVVLQWAIVDDRSIAADGSKVVDWSGTH
jgi:WD40 repeat protein